MRDFFRSDPYIKYRGVLTSLIDVRTAQLVTTMDMTQIPALQAEVRMLVYVRDELPKVLSGPEEESLKVPDPDEIYSAPEEESTEDSEEEEGEDDS